MSRVLVTGAAGFIGSHLVDRLAAAGHQVVGVDNLSRGREEFLAGAMDGGRVQLVRADLADQPSLFRALAPVAAAGPIHEVWHLAANSDIPAGVADPAVDLRDTFLTTFNILEWMHGAGVRTIAFASTSAVYGVQDGAIAEDSGPLLPISSYGAMKLAGEATISAAKERFLERALLFRFPNVVGPRATHGVIFDLLGKLKRDQPELEVLGDGTQCKPYLHVHDLIDAMLHIHAHAAEPLACYNIGPLDEGAEVAFIARQVLAAAGSTRPIRFTGGARGWVGDVPRFHYDVGKLLKLGWRPPCGSPAAVTRAAGELAREHGFCRG